MFLDMHQANTNEVAGRSSLNIEQGAIKEVLPGNRQEQEGSGEAQQSTRQAFGGTSEALIDKEPGAGNQPKPLSSLGETS